MKAGQNVLVADFGFDFFRYDLRDDPDFSWLIQAERRIHRCDEDRMDGDVRRASNVQASTGETGENMVDEAVCT